MIPVKRNQDLNWLIPFLNVCKLEFLEREMKIRGKKVSYLNVSRNVDRFHAGLLDLFENLFNENNFYSLSLVLYIYFRFCIIFIYHLGGKSKTRSSIFPLSYPPTHLEQWIDEKEKQQELVVLPYLLLKISTHDFTIIFIDADCRRLACSSYWEEDGSACRAGLWRVNLHGNRSCRWWITYIL